MNDNNNIMSDRTIMIIMYIFFAVVSVFYGIKLSIPLVLDEVGTMANTAVLVGEDWSGTVDLMGAFYYKYGHSLLYVPIFLIFKNSILRYKAIMVFQSLILSTVPLIAYKICRKHLKIEDKKIAASIAVVGGSIPSMWLYSYYARAEMLILYLPWVIMLCMLEVNRAGEEDNKKRQMILSVLLAFLAVYGYAAHTRGIVYVLAVAMTVILIKIFLKKDIVRWIPYLSSTVIFMILDKIAAGYFKRNIFRDFDSRHASVESVEFSYLKNIFTFSGMKSMFKLCLGWLYNAFCSTYGLVALALVAAVLILTAALRKHKNITMEETLLTLYTLLNFLGSFVMGVLFFFHHAHKHYTGKKIIKATDILIYGRYIAAPIGLLCILAIYVLFYKKDILKLKGKIASVFLYFGTLVLFFAKAAPYLDGYKTRTRYFMSLTTFLDIEPYGATTRRFDDLSGALLKAAIFASVIFIIILVLSFEHRKKIVQIATCSIIFITSAYIFRTDFLKVRESYNVVSRENTDQVNEYIQGFGDLYKEYPYIFRDNKALNPKYYQFPQPNYKFSGNKRYKEGKDNLKNCLIICSKKRIPSLLYEDDYYSFHTFDYENAKKDILLVKGEELKEKLEGMGYQMEKYILEEKTE